MPHLVLEHSAEIADTHDLPALSRALFNAACESDLFANPAAVKTRTMPCQNVRMGSSPQTFAHLTVWLLSGRSTTAKAQLAEELMFVLDKHLPDVGSLSVDPRDMTTETYLKRVL